MILEKLILDDFLTYEHLEHVFEKRPLMIQGLNLTDERQRSNGSGKSGMQTGIEFCITASNSRDVRDAELVSFGQKQARAQLIASCDIRKERIHIDWIINIKGSNKLVLTKQSYDGAWEEISFSNVNDGKKYILDWFAISKEDLFNYYIINKTRFKSFFKSSNKEKVDLINRFSDASIIDGLEKIDNSKLDQQYKDIQTNIDKIDGKLEYLKDNLQQEELRDFEEEFAQQAQEIKQQQLDAEQDRQEILQEMQEIEVEKNHLTKQNEELDASISAITIKVKGAQKLVDDFITSDWDEKFEKANVHLKKNEDKIEIANDKLQQVFAKQSKINKLIKSLEIEMSGAIVCPSCSHEFVVDCTHGTLEEMKQKAQQANQLLIKTEDIVTQHNSELKLASDSMKKIRDVVSQLSQASEVERKEHSKLSQTLQLIQRELMSLEKAKTKLGGEISECDVDLRECESDLKILQARVKSCEDQIKGLKRGSNEGLIKQIKTDVKSLNKEKLNLEIELNSVGDEIYKRNQWINNFKQFRMHLANQSLEAIEFHCNRYLAEMGSDLQVKMEGFKMLANGTFKDEITAKIIRNVERSFSSFSGGEQGRLLFASILANRHMINSTHPYGGLDFLSVDEVFEGVDSLGLKYLVQSAKQLNICVMLITHVTDEEVGEDTLLIVKEGGVSKIQK